jgi:hypothetical protein
LNPSEVIFTDRKELILVINASEIKTLVENREIFSPEGTRLYNLIDNLLQEGKPITFIAQMGWTFICNLRILGLVDRPFLSYAGQIFREMLSQIIQEVIFKLEEHQTFQFLIADLPAITVSVTKLIIHQQSQYLSALTISGLGFGQAELLSAGEIASQIINLVQWEN